jgi:hypothetical protein
MTKPIPELLALARDVEREAFKYAELHPFYKGCGVSHPGVMAEKHFTAGSHAMHAKLAPVIEEMGRAFTDICITYNHPGEDVAADYAHVCKLAREALAKVRGMLEKP